MINYSLLDPKNISAAVFVVLLFLGLEGFGQTLGTPSVSGAPACAGSSVTVSFLVTNGMGQENGNGNGVGAGAEKYFTTATTYTLELLLNNTPIQQATISFNSTTAPTAAGGATATIVKDFFIPSNLSFSTQYQVKISSANPSPTGNSANQISAPFEVHALISNNSISGGQFGCNPYASQQITGSIPAGGNNIYSYLWESSTTSPTTGFSPAPGNNSTQNYGPGTLTQTTWYRRIVTSGACTDTTEAVEINITNDNTWTGSIDNDWNTPGNWSCNAVPIPATNVIIPSVTNPPVLNTGAAGTANNINIESGAKLTILNNTLQVGGIISNSGTFDSQNGSLNFVGTTPQILAAGSLLNNRITNLVVDNAAGLTLNGPVEVTGTVLVQTGNINSNGNLKLISDTKQTALIDGSGMGEVLGNTVMQRYLDVAYGYKYFSTPFNNSTVGDFSPFIELADPVTGFPHFYAYDESRQSNGEDASGWVIANSSGTALDPGFGYAVNFGNSTTPTTVELSGQVNNGQIDVNLPNNNGAYTRGFHLLGNPYASPIDWTQVSRTNVEDAIYFFTAGNSDQYTGVYSSVVAGVSNDGKSSAIIPSMQGFFVKVVDGTSGSISFQNSARVNDFSQAFLKSQKKNKNISSPLVRLRAGFDKELTDALVVYFPKNGKPEFEKDKDAQKLFNTDPNVPSFYSILENEQKLSINALPVSDRPIPLGVKAARTGKMIISLQTANIEDQVYLQDFETGQVINLSEKGTYRFQIGKGEHNDRFQLFFSEENLTQPKEETFSPLSVFTRENTVIVKLNLGNNQESLVQLINLNGQVVQSRSVKGEQIIEFNDLPVPGVCIVSLLIDEKRFSKKIILPK